ncbi:peptidyl-prolyl cis-trans isomerase D [Duganella sp. CF458]|uniref:SurA N-terminal domain-containing protein n=1 Tax=Duganella sp. CF458 TaxID=1884368 RepID=UPI0008EFB015|nr:SurA N-terminal domain-containing protein [Duganella sp. CF458]SFG69241.1 peptidyl-prolyl cis-trans isomerase D [Duganella sp. CF458]
MFDFVRTHQKLMQIILALLIVPSFVLVGVGGVKLFGEDANTIAKVAGYPLTQQEWENAQRRQLDQMRQQMGKNFDQKAFDTPEFKQNILDQLIAQRAMNAEIRTAHLTVSEQKVQEAITSQLPLFKADGSFDKEQYLQILAAQGMNAGMHQEQVRHDLALQQVATGVELSGFVPRTVSKAISDFGAQEREVQELALPVSQFLPNVKVTDEMVKAFYDKNAKLFEIPESAKIEYVVLNADAIASQTTVSDEEVAGYYESNKKRYTDEEARRSSHILILSEKDKAAAKAKAEAILADVRKNPADFGKIAKAKSEDPGSAEKDGDLGVLEKGRFVKPVEDAILKLKQGEISDLVESEYGYHIITVTEVKPAQVKPLEEVKGEIAAEIKKQKAAKLYSDLSEQFTDTVYSQYESLKPAADKLKLKIETMAGISRQPNPILGAAPFNNAKFLTALFSDDALKNKRNTEAVEVAPQTLVSGRIVEFKPASKKPLAEVEAAIKQQVTLEEAVKAAKKAGEEKLAAAKKSGDASGFSDVKTISRSKADGINPAAVAAVMKADASKLPAYVGVEIPGQGYGVYRIGKVGQPAEQDAARREQEGQRINQIVSQQEMTGYIDALKQKAKVKILHPVATIKTQAE